MNNSKIEMKAVSQVKGKSGWEVDGGKAGGKTETAQQQRETRGVACLAERLGKVMTAGKRKQSGSVSSAVRTETEKGPIDQVAVGHGGFVPESGGRYRSNVIHDFTQG